jgi:hypothetical protein
MNTVMFTFKEHASDEHQDRVRDQVLGLPGVRSVGRIAPEATKPALRRLWYAEVADKSAADNLVMRLRERDEIESADLPAARGLL